MTFIANDNLVARADSYLFSKIFSLSKSTLLAKSSYWVSKTGDGYLYFICAIGLVFWEHEFGRLFFYQAIAAFSLYLPVYFLMKHSLKRQRPYRALSQLKSLVVPSDQFSMPSGHTACAMLMATTIAQFYPQWAVICFIWASLIGISRVLLGVHFPGDVAVGTLIGIACALLSIEYLPQS